MSATQDNRLVRVSVRWAPPADLARARCHTSVCCGNDSPGMHPQTSALRQGQRDCPSYLV